MSTHKIANIYEKADFFPSTFPLIESVDCKRIPKFPAPNMLGPQISLP